VTFIDLAVFKKADPFEELAIQYDFIVVKPLPVKP
jgi:hypothetical protein